MTGSPPAVRTERPAEPAGAPPSARGRSNIGRRALVILLVLVTAGGALRAWEAAHPYLERQSPDEVAYARLAVGLVEQQRYGDPRLDSLHWPPGAPAMFALGYALHRDPDLRVAYWLQAARRHAADRRHLLPRLGARGRGRGPAAPPRSSPSTRPSSRRRASC